MWITLNGERREVRAHVSLADLLVDLDVDSRRTAVERNRMIVKKDAYASTLLAEGDRLEIVTLVGGG